MSRTVLLGPLGAHPQLAAELAALDVDGPVGLITAGWEEAERNDAEVDRALGGGTRNLGLFGRQLDVLESDPDYAVAVQLHRLRRAELQTLYRIRLQHALAAVDAIRRRSLSARRSVGTELDEAIAEVRGLDDAHTKALADAAGEFAAAFPPQDRDVIAAHRAAANALLEECAAVAIAGGHVEVLLDCIRLSDVSAALAARPLLAWSSGSMVVTERVLVVDDGDIAARPAEIVAPGLGSVSGVVAIPDASRRLRDGDPDHLALIARRCAPRACVLLDPGERLACDAGGRPDLQGVRLVSLEGRVRFAAEAA